MFELLVNELIWLEDRNCLPTAHKLLVQCSGLQIQVKLGNNIRMPFEQKKIRFVIEQYSFFSLIKQRLVSPYIILSELGTGREKSTIGEKVKIIYTIVTSSKEKDSKASKAQKQQQPSTFNSTVTNAKKDPTARFQLLMDEWCRASKEDRQSLMLKGMGGRFVHSIMDNDPAVKRYSNVNLLI